MRVSVQVCRLNTFTKSSLKKTEEVKYLRKKRKPEKQGAPGGAVHVPLSSLPGQWPRQKQVIPSAPLVKVIMVTAKENIASSFVVQALTVVLALSSLGPMWWDCEWDTILVHKDSLLRIHICRLSGILLHAYSMF